MRHFYKLLLLFTILLYIVQLTSCSKRKYISKPTISKPNTVKPNTSSRILDKYTAEIGVPIDNEVLYESLDQWIGTPYSFGGKSHSGIDCSNFVCTMLRDVYGFPTSFYFPSAKLAEQGETISLSNAQEGDIVCFSINQNSKISHVGIYLANRKFVHASTSKGVIISSLTDSYYKPRLSHIKRLKLKNTN